MSKRAKRAKGRSGRKRGTPAYQSSSIPRSAETSGWVSKVDQGGLSKEDWSYNEKRGCPMVVRKRRQADVQRRGVDVQWWCPMVVVNGGEWWSGGLRWMDGGGRSRNRWVSKEERGQEGGKSRFTPLCLPAASIDLDASECALLPRGCWRAQSRDRRLLLPRDADRAA